MSRFTIAYHMTDPIISINMTKNTIVFSLLKEPLYCNTGLINNMKIIYIKSYKYIIYVYMYMYIFLH